MDRSWLHLSERLPSQCLIQEITLKLRFECLWQSQTQTWNGCWIVWCDNYKFYLTTAQPFACLELNSIANSTAEEWNGFQNWHLHAFKSTKKKWTEHLREKKECSKLSQTGWTINFHVLRIHSPRSCDDEFKKASTRTNANGLVSHGSRNRKNKSAKHTCNLDSVEQTWALWELNEEWLQAPSRAHESPGRWKGLLLTRKTNRRNKLVSTNAVE
jgi:hypothetical protein